MYLVSRLFTHQRHVLKHAWMMFGGGDALNIMFSGEKYVCIH